jgi:uncharacterized membrane protein YcaP (DUF421 family)
METVLRVALIYVFILFALRLIGKRELSQLAPQDLIVLLLIPEIVSHGMIRDDYSLTNAIIGVSTLLTIVFLTSTLTYLSKPVRTVLEGYPAVLVQSGRLIKHNLDRERVPPDEILSEMRRAGIKALDRVRWAILEPDGKISFIESGKDDRHGPPDENEAV